MKKSHEDLFVELLETNKDRIFRICRAYSKEQEEAKDLFQEVLLQIWKSLSSFEFKSSIHTWAFRITINTCLQAKQFQIKKDKLFTHLKHDIEGVQISTYSSENEALFIHLYECISNLEGIDKSIMLLHLEEMSHKEIGNITGITENYVAVKIKRIKAKLFNCIKDKI